ncbi:MAG: TraB/GumN family protein [Saprospiraceae bacterium]|nr:TraB/GumN family protein [Saprospiraceae bacterium]
MNGSVLWKILSPSGQSSYLMGTMHVKDNVAYTHVRKAESKLSYCTHYFGEIDLDHAQEIIQPEDYLLPKGQHLRQLISVRHYQKMAAVLAKVYGVSLDGLGHFYPLMIVNQISEILLKEDNALALDHYLWMKAKEEGKQMGGVEAVDRQVEILHSLDLDSQIKALKDLCRRVRQFNKSVLKLVSLYEQEDIQKIYQLSKKQLGKLRTLMLYERNLNMADFIANQAHLNAFYAVGAAHLGGNKGILALLKRRGWQLMPLRS